MIELDLTEVYVFYYYKKIKIKTQSNIRDAYLNPNTDEAKMNGERLTSYQLSVSHIMWKREKKTKIQTIFHYILLCECQGIGSNWCVPYETSDFYRIGCRANVCKPGACAVLNRLGRSTTLKSIYSSNKAIA